MPVKSRWTLRALLPTLAAALAFAGALALGVVTPEPARATHCHHHHPGHHAFGFHHYHRSHDCGDNYDAVGRSTHVDHICY